MVELLLSLAHLLQERLEGHEAIIVLRLTELLHEALGLLLGQLLTEVDEELEELISLHGVVSIFVVELQDLNEVVEASLVLGVLAGLVQGEDVSLGQELGALGRVTTDFLDGLQGGVLVAGADEVADVEGVNLAISLEVIDIEGEFDGWNEGIEGMLRAIILKEHARESQGFGFGFASCKCNECSEDMLRATILNGHTRESQG